MDPILLIVFLLIFTIAGLGWIIRLTYSTGALHEMNAGARLYQETRYAEAEAHFRRLLTKSLSSGVEADTRRRLADTLDILGKPSEAAAERDCAKAIVTQSPRDARAHQARGDLLKREYQYDAACEAYLQALAKSSSQDKPARALIMAKLTFAHHDAGRTAEALTWAKKSLASLPNPNIRRAMNGMAGVGYADQGDLEQAERHYREALRLAEQQNSMADAARYSGLLAGLKYKQGQFQEAVAMCREVRAISEGPSEILYVTEVECLRDIGKFDEAREVIAQWRLALAYPQPALQRRIQALADFAAATVEVRAEQPEAALAFLEKARLGFEAKAMPSEETWPPSPQKGDDKLLLWCDATKVLALAQRGDAQASRLLCDEVVSRSSLFLEDRGTQNGVYSTLGRAAFVLGDLAECKKLFEIFLDWKPSPVGLLSAHYWLGETHLRLGETETARDFFRQAVAPGIDSLDARRAAARLAELGG